MVNIKKQEKSIIQKGVALSHPLEEIRVLDFNIKLIEYKKDIYTPVYRLYENIGLNKNNYKKRTKSLEQRGIDFKYLSVPTAQGYQKSLCINIFDIPILLYLINISRIKPELRERVQ